jgi:hypothetical protein
MNRLPRRTAFVTLIVAVILSTATIGMTEALASNGKGPGGQGATQGQASQGKGVAGGSQRGAAAGVRANADGGLGSQQGGSEGQDDGPDGESTDGSSTGTGSGNGKGNGPGNRPAGSGTDASGASGSDGGGAGPAVPGDDGNKATGQPAAGSVFAAPSVTATPQAQATPVATPPGMTVSPAVPVDDEPGERGPAEENVPAVARPASRPIVDPAPPAHAFGVLALAARGLGPAVAASQAVQLAERPEAAELQGSTGFVAGFRILAEDVRTDLTAHAVLGLLLLWLSLRRIDGFLPKARSPRSPVSHDD